MWELKLINPICSAASIVFAGHFIIVLNSRIVHFLNDGPVFVDPFDSSARILMDLYFLMTVPSLLTHLILPLIY